MAEEKPDTPSEIATCKFLVQRKKRFCKAAPIEGRSYCVEHSHLDEASDDRKRIPCPLDPKHTVFEDSLKKHLKKCNSRPKSLPAYHVFNINSGATGSVEEPAISIELKDVPPEEIISLAEKIATIYDGLSLRFLDFRGRCHDVVASELASGGVGGTKRGRHLSQVGALLAMLESQQLLAGRTAFVEMGAGRGELAHWVQRAMSEDSEVCYVLVDRASPRHKFDWKHKWGDGPLFHRLRIDIEHLDLSKIAAIPDTYRLLCLSKHLCGDATDLALRCAANYCDAINSDETKLTQDPENGCSTPKQPRARPTHRLAGLLIALCCHHRCSWKQFCGREAMLGLGIMPADFHLMTRMATWATCGAKEPESGVHARFGKLSVGERQDIGRKCKRLIDYGRVRFLEKRFPHVNLCYYVEEKDSLENVAIFCHH